MAAMRDVFWNKIFEEAKTNRDKDGNTIEKGTSHQKDTTIINFYESNNEAKPNQWKGK